MEKINSFIRGGIYLAKLNPSKYDEIGKLRPVIILTSQRILNTAPPFVFICPLSSKSHENFRYLHRKIPSRGKLEVTSYALIEHCKSISINRLEEACLCVLTQDELAKIKENILCLINGD